MKQAIIIHSMHEENTDGFFKKRLIYKLKYPKYVDLNGGELIFEYGVDNIEAIGDSAIFSLLPVAFWENVDIEITNDIEVSKSLPVPGRRTVYRGSNPGFQGAVRVGS